MFHEHLRIHVSTDLDDFIFIVEFTDPGILVREGQAILAFGIDRLHLDSCLVTIANDVLNLHFQRAGPS